MTKLVIYRACMMSLFLFRKRQIFLSLSVSVVLFFNLLNKANSGEPTINRDSSTAKVVKILSDPNGFDDEETILTCIKLLKGALSQRSVVYTSELGVGYRDSEGLAWFGPIKILSGEDVTLRMTYREAENYCTQRRARLPFSYELERFALQSGAVYGSRPVLRNPHYFPLPITYKAAYWSKETQEGQAFHYYMGPSDGTYDRNEVDTREYGVEDLSRFHSKRTVYAEVLCVQDQ